MTTEWLILIPVAPLVGGFLAWLLLRPKQSADASQVEMQLRLQQMLELQNSLQLKVAEQMQQQERAIRQALDERLGDVSKRVGESLTSTQQQTVQQLSELQARLAVIDAAQKQIHDLSGQVGSLRSLLSQPKWRGAYGETQLMDILHSALPPQMIAEQATLSNGSRADCVLNLPNPPGKIVVDAKFPLDSYRLVLEATEKSQQLLARQQLKKNFEKHLTDIARKYIIPSETADCAMMFLPSEAVYAELYAYHHDVVEKSHQLRVFVVSPSTMMAMLTTIRAVMKDVRLREQAGLVKKIVNLIKDDCERLSERVDKLAKNFGNLTENVREIETSRNKIANNAAKMLDIETTADELRITTALGASAVANDRDQQGAVSQLPKIAQPTTT